MRGITGPTHVTGGVAGECGKPSPASCAPTPSPKAPRSHHPPKTRRAVRTTRGCEPALSTKSPSIPPVGSVTQLQPALKMLRDSLVLQNAFAELRPQMTVKWNQRIANVFEPCISEIYRSRCSYPRQPNLARETKCQESNRLPDSRKQLSKISMVGWISPKLQSN